jgi:hypothetical protein
MLKSFTSDGSYVTDVRLLVKNDFEGSFITKPISWRSIKEIAGGFDEFTPE